MLCVIKMSEVTQEEKGTETNVIENIKPEEFYGKVAT